MIDIVLHTHSSPLHQVFRLQLLLCHPSSKISLVGANKEIKDNFSPLRGTLT